MTLKSIYRISQKAANNASVSCGSFFHTARSMSTTQTPMGYCMARQLFLLLLLTALITGCSPTVKVAAPDKPITINLNVKIEHHIKVKIDKELDDVLNEDSGLF